jgi:uncharacterized membrane protein
VIGKKVLITIGMEKPKRILSLTVGILGLALIIFILNLIPVIGFFLSGLISFAISMIGVGAIVANKIKHMKLRSGK